MDQQSENKKTCAAVGKCGGCTYLHESYEKQLKVKEAYVRKCLTGLCEVRAIRGMEDPYHYRNKVHAVFARAGGKIVTGSYQEGTHRVVPVQDCLLEDVISQKIIRDVAALAQSFKLTVYFEDQRRGLLRHILVRRGFTSGQILVVLVTSGPVFPSRKNFTQALLKLHPEITSLVMNINDRDTSFIVGERNIPLFGKGYIEDELLGKRFRISPSSFYQVNPIQTEKLYRKAAELAACGKGETVIDAYCGIGTIGLCAGSAADRVIGVELNPNAAADARVNAKLNNAGNVRFVCADATEWMAQAAAAGESADVVFLDPPRSGSTPAFIKAVSLLKPGRIVYISCCPDTLARDLKLFRKAGYEGKEAWPFDMFPWTKAEHVETVIRLDRRPS